MSMFLSMDRIKLHALISCLLLLVMSTCCVHSCSDTVGTPCEVVDASECQASLSDQHSQPYSRQLHANMAASFVNLTVMVDDSLPEPYRRTLRLVLTSWLGLDQIKLKEMFILVTPSEGNTEWASCLKISLTTDVGKEWDKTLSVLLPTHQNITSYRMAMVSQYQDGIGQLAFGHTNYLIKFSDLKYNRDWILPVVASTTIGDAVLFSLTPPSPRIHRNILNCSTWLITCGGRGDQLQGALEGNEPDATRVVNALQGSDEWGVGNCQYYEDELLLRSNMRFPSLSMKVPKGKYQLWIDCVLQNPLSPWPSTRRTIRTPTFTHPGTGDFFIKVQWKNKDKGSALHSHSLTSNLQHYAQHTEFPHDLNSDIPTAVSNRALDGNSSDEINVILVICLASIALLVVGIGAAVICKTKVFGQRCQVIKDRSEDKNRPMRLQQDWDSSNSNSGDISTAESSLNNDETGEEGPDSPRMSLIETARRVTPHLHHYKETPMDATAYSCSTVLNLRSAYKNSKTGDSFYHYRNEYSDNKDDEELSDEDNVSHTEVIPLNVSRRYSLTTPLTLPDCDVQSHYVEINSSNLSPPWNKKLEDTVHLSSNDISSSLGYHSYSHQLPPIKQPMILLTDMRADSVNFDNLLQSFNNSNVNDWRLKREADIKLDVGCVTDECVLYGETVP